MATNNKCSVICICLLQSCSYSNCLLLKLVGCYVGLSMPTKIYGVENDLCYPCVLL